MYATLLIGLIMSLIPTGWGVKTVFITKNAELTLFSEAPIENIEAVSKSAYGIINTESGEIQFGVSIRSFKFRKSLMQEHFNENYMESDKYPAARFKGKLNTPIDISKDGEYSVVATGDLEVHGITKRRSLSGTIKVLNGRLEVNSVFEVKCRDHEIKIPALVFKNIAETIKITLKGTFSTVTKSNIYEDARLIDSFFAISLPKFCSKYGFSHAKYFFGSGHRGSYSVI